VSLHTKPSFSTLVAGHGAADAHVADANAKPSALTSSTARVAILGATGYSGQEFLRLAERHPGLRIVALSAQENAGVRAGDAIPGLDARAVDFPDLVVLGEIEAAIANGEVDTVVSCLPHVALKQALVERPGLARAARIIDLSADHRDGAEGWVYGLPERDRLAMAGATRVANPGCYPTAAALALLPAAEAGWIRGPVMVHGVSGVSGAGRGADRRTSFVEIAGGASIYSAGHEHAHVAEMERFLAHAGAAVSVGFVPQLVPMSRGILLSASIALEAEVSTREARELYAARYAGEPFVRLLDEGRWPETRAVQRSNRADVSVVTLNGGRTMLACAAIDNLVKGAAGQALQNLNVMLGWPETTGLPRHGTPW